MKRLLLLLIVLTLLLTACSSVEPTPTSNLAESLEVKDYSCVIDEQFAYYVAFVTNTADKTVDVEINITAKDADGKMVGSGDDQVLAVGSGQTSGLWTTFDDWRSIASFDYVLNVKESSYQSIKDSVSFEHEERSDRVVISATNTGDKDADYVWVDVVFLKDGEMVNFHEIMLTNSDSVLPAGQTLTGEGEIYSQEGFDEAMYAYNGRIHK